MYPRPGAEGSKAGFPLRSVLGLTNFADLGITLTRAIHAANGSLWVAGSGKLWEIASDATVTSRGTIIDSVDTFISANGTKITICAGGTYYVWDGSTLDIITGGAITTESTVDFHAQYTLLTESTPGKFEWPEPPDPKTRNGLHFQTAEGPHDNPPPANPHGRQGGLVGRGAQGAGRGHKGSVDQLDLGPAIAGLARRHEFIIQGLVVGNGGDDDAFTLDPKPDQFAVDHVGAGHGNLEIRHLVLHRRQVPGARTGVADDPDGAALLTLQAGDGAKDPFVVGL